VFVKKNRPKCSQSKVLPKWMSNFFRGQK
jgi:hypothetical protein